MHDRQTPLRGRTLVALLGTALILSLVPAALFAEAPRSGEIAAAEPGGPAALEDAFRLFGTSPEHGPLVAAAQVAAKEGVDRGLLAMLLSRGWESEYPVPDLIRAVQRVHRAHLRGLPVQRLVSRYIQGMAKRVPAPGVESAAARLEGQLDEAAKLVNAAFPGEETALSPADRLTAIDYAASAIQAGADDGVLRRSLALASDAREPLVATHAPLLTLGILVASGVDPSRSLDLVANAWDHGIRGGDLERLGKTVGSFSRNGEGPPPEVLDQVLQILERNTGADLIFEGLDNLDRVFRDGSLVPGFDPSINRKPGTRRPGDEPQLPTQSDSGAEGN